MARRGRKCCSGTLYAAFRNEQLAYVQRRHQCGEGLEDVTEEFQWQVSEQRRLERERQSAPAKSG